MFTNNPANKKGIVPSCLAATSSCLYCSKSSQMSLHMSLKWSTSGCIWPRGPSLSLYRYWFLFTQHLMDEQWLFFQNNGVKCPNYLVEYKRVHILLNFI